MRGDNSGRARQTGIESDSQAILRKTAARRMRGFGPKCQGYFEARRALTHLAPHPYEDVCKNRSNVATESPQDVLFKRNTSQVKMQAKSPPEFCSDNYAN